MRLPWVSRAALDLAETRIQQLERLEAIRDAALERERDRSNALTLELIKLHQVVTTPPPGPDEQARRDWAVIEDALDSVGLAGAARRQQVDWAERMLRRGTKAAEVAELVRRGADDDGA